MIDKDELEAMNFQLGWPERALVFLLACSLAFLAFQFMRWSAESWSLSKLEAEKQELGRGKL